MRADYDKLLESGKIATSTEKKNHTKEKQSAACRQVKYSSARSMHSAGQYRQGHA